MVLRFGFKLDPVNPRDMEIVNWVQSLQPRSQDKKESFLDALYRGIKGSSLKVEDDRIEKILDKLEYLVVRVEREPIQVKKEEVKIGLLSKASTLNEEKEVKVVAYKNNDLSSVLSSMKDSAFD